MSSPAISVILPVYNSEKFLSDSIDSIVNQTFEDFELLIINDGSTDHSEEIIRSKKDQRIVYIKNRKNLGIAKSLNKGLALANGEFIARMDADDIAVRSRFERQFLFLREHSTVDILGSEVILIDENKKVIRVDDSGGFSDNDVHKICLLKGNTLNHPTVILRKGSLQKMNLAYDDSFQLAEDYKFWTDASVSGLIINSVKEPLLQYRVHMHQFSNIFFEQQEEVSVLIQKMLGYHYFHQIDDFDVALYIKLIKGIPASSNHEQQALRRLIDKIRLFNKNKGFFNTDLFEKIILKSSCR